MTDGPMDGFCRCAALFHMAVDVDGDVMWMCGTGMHTGVRVQMPTHIVRTLWNLGRQTLHHNLIVMRREIDAEHPLYG